MAPTKIRVVSMARKPSFVKKVAVIIKKISSMYSMVHFQPAIYVHYWGKFIKKFSFQYHWVWHFKFHSRHTFWNLFDLLKQGIGAWHFSVFYLKIGSLEFFQIGVRSWKFWSKFDRTSAACQNYDSFIGEARILQNQHLFEGKVSKVRRRRWLHKEEFTKTWFWC